MLHFDLLGPLPAGSSRSATVGRRLRFAMMTTFYPPFHFGGDATFVRSLTHALAGRGHEVTVIHDRDAFRALKGDASRQPLPEPPGVTVHGLESKRPTLSCTATHQFGRPVVHGGRIAEILSKGFDVIHYHNISLLGGPGLLEIGDAVKIYTAHEHWLVCPTHILWRHNRELCTGRECVRCMLHYNRPLQPWRAGSLLERSGEHVDAFTTLSQSCVDRHREFGFPFPMEILSPFLPDSAERPADGPPPERPYFLFVGRLEAIKGLQDVIEAMRTDSPVELWVAGSGSYEAELRKLAKDKPSVRFLGFREPVELRRLYRHARAVVLPSLCYEVFPMVVLEAFREGAPILARRRGPFPEIVETSGGGLLFESRDELREALDLLAGDDRLKARLAKSASEAFEAHWTESAGLENYFDLIRRLGKNRGLDLEQPAPREADVAAHV